jgi:hypothetical protein
MAQFKYTLPSGKQFTMNAPAGTTQVQADRIFYSQVAAGTFAGFSAGQSIGGPQTAAVKFALSRLDRGTAGVDDQVILSIVNGLPTVSGYPDLVNVPLENPISQADLANINNDNTYTATEIGPLNSNQVQGLLAQIANFVNQPANVMTNTAGVGQYGLTAPQLEMAGYVKPGTYRQFIFDPTPLVDVLSAPGIWTGKNGINSAQEFLNNPSSQNDAMTTLMSQSYDNLTAVGTITPPVTPSVSSLFGQIYTQSGLQTVSQLSTVTGITLPSTAGLSIAGSPVAKLLSTNLTDPGSIASGALNTTGSFNISAITSKLENTVTGGVAALVTNGSIFGTGAATQWANSGSINQILTGGGFGASFGLPTTALTNNIQGLDVLGKSSQFASGFANPLSSLNNLGGVSLTSLTSSLPSLSSITSQLPSISSLASQLPSISSLTSQLPSLSSLGLGNFGGLFDLAGIGSFADIGGLFGGGGDALVSSTQVAAGYNNTVNRSTVDAAFRKILGSNKIPNPVFDYPGPRSPSTSSAQDVAYAETQLQDQAPTA